MTVSGYAYPVVMSWRDSPTEKANPMPYLQIDADTWAILRENPDRPKAMIRRFVAIDGVEQYLLFTWHSDPHQQRLIRMYDTLDDANRAVKWARPDPQVPSQPPSTPR